MVPVTEQAHEFLRQHLSPGGIVIDATAGNGHDTLFLAQHVGPAGRVFAIDIQPQALEKTSLRLGELAACVTLLPGDHAQLRQLLPAEVSSADAIVFNLGYLPGGDKRIITRTLGTLSALEQSLTLLRNGGVLCVVAYPGHPGGQAEAEAVRSWFQQAGERGMPVQFPDEQYAGSGPRLFTLIRIAE